MWLYVAFLLIIVIVVFKVSEYKKVRKYNDFNDLLTDDDINNRIQTLRKLRLLDEDAIQLRNEYIKRLEKKIDAKKRSVELSKLVIYENIKKIIADQVLKCQDDCLFTIDAKTFSRGELYNEIHNDSEYGISYVKSKITEKLK